MPPIAREDSYAVTAGQPVYAGRMGTPPPGVGALLTTLTLQNTSAAVQAAGFVSPMFGLPLKQGDMPAGQYPQFKLTDGTNCPASIWGVSSWPDGSMKFCAAMVRVPSSVAGSGTLALQVYSGGTTPAPSARTTSDLTTADIKVELTGITNLSGAWTASLNTAITDATDMVVIGDGPAGKVWRIGGPCKQSGSPHGQLYAWHYVAALTNSIGGLLGLRYLGKVAQPFIDVASPTPTRRVVTATLLSGASTVRNIQGYDDADVLGANINFPHFSSFFTAGPDAKWDFVQAGGTASVDCTLRATLDKTHVVKTRLVPPYKTSLSVTSGPSADYRPAGTAGMERTMGMTGERPDIGVLPTWAPRHLITQSANDERKIRAVGLSSAHWRSQVMQSSTNRIVVGTSPSASYAGLGTSRPTWRYYPGEPAYYYGGAIAPADGSSRWSSEYESSHRPSTCYYPYLVTGEPQYLDLLVENAASLVMLCIPGSKTMNLEGVTSSTITIGAVGERDVIVGSTTYNGGGFPFLGGLLRIQAWLLRDFAQAAAIYPDTCPASTGTRAYFREILSNSYSAINAYNAALSPEWAASGIYNFDNRNGAAGTWGNGYMSNSVCHQASIIDTPEAATFRNYLGRFWENISGIMDIGAAIAYGSFVYDWTTGVRFTNVQDITYSTNTYMVFSTGTNRFTVSGEGSRPGSWSPTNGDVIQFPGPSDPDADYVNKPFSLVEMKKYYVVNASGQTAQLAETPGGTPITITSAVTVGPKFYGLIQNLSPHYSWEGGVWPDGYFCNVASAIQHHAASGDPGISSAVAMINSKLTSAAVDFTSDPKNALTSEYPA